MPRDHRGGDGAARQYVEALALGAVPGSLRGVAGMAVGERERAPNQAQIRCKPGANQV